MNIIPEYPQRFKIIKIRKDSPVVNTYILEGELDSKPGQFVMLWLPGIDEKPISIAYQNKNEIHLTIAAIGPFTKAMTQCKVGDSVGVRGPFGSKFTTEKQKKYCLVGGGVGVPPLANIAYNLQGTNTKIDFIIGGRSKEHIIFKDEMENIGVNVHVCTDDGSEGFHGFTTQLLEKLLEEDSLYDIIQTCGPEMMMKKIVEIAQLNNIYSEVSIERYMKCGFGVCGACSVDGKGKRMCYEGPVVEGKTALSWEEFGKYHRSATGQKI